MMMTTTRKTRKTKMSTMKRTKKISNRVGAVEAPIVEGADARHPLDAGVDGPRNQVARILMHWFRSLANAVGAVVEAPSLNSPYLRCLRAGWTNSKSSRIRARLHSSKAAQPMAQHFAKLRYHATPRHVHLSSLSARPLENHSRFLSFSLSFSLSLFLSFFFSFIVERYV